MAKKITKPAGPVTQPNAGKYQHPVVSGGNVGEPPPGFIDPRNAREARQFESRFNPGRHAGSARVGSPEQEAANPPRHGKIPSGATGIPKLKGKGK